MRQVSTKEAPDQDAERTSKFGRSSSRSMAFPAASTGAQSAEAASADDTEEQRVSVPAGSFKFEPKSSMGRGSDVKSSQRLSMKARQSIKALKDSVNPYDLNPEKLRVHSGVD